MKCTVIVALTALVAVQANPKPGIGLGGFDMGLGLGGGIGGIGGYGGSGGGYLQNGYTGGQQGYNQGSYGGGAMNLGHNIGHNENDFDAEVHHHQSSGHNIGGIMEEGQGGSQMGGYGGYGEGSTGMGNGWSHGGFI